ncbi:MAG: polyprenyl synthetase family protein [bacterium]|nr:polyprenyl synthetase family protein [bacterium]
MKTELKGYLEEKRVFVDGELARLLPHKGAYPPDVHEALHYAVFSGGKRLRAILVLAAAEAVTDVLPDGAVEAACAVECIHNYSLIHDDLPCMDADELRRGRPTVWKKFGEAVAVLTGDALLTVAFQILALGATREIELSDRLLLCSQELATASGTFGMIGGQAADVANEGKDIDASMLEFIHTLKTGALIRCACRMGAILARADDPRLMAATRYGEHLGMAFQIADDLLNVTGDEAKLGKSVGSDEKRGKNTYPKIHGVEKSREMAKFHVDSAVDEAKRLPRPEILAELAKFVVERDH